MLRNWTLSMRRSGERRVQKRRALGAAWLDALALKFMLGCPMQMSAGLA
jgi:hypothetical protein